MSEDKVTRLIRELRCVRRNGAWGLAKPRPEHQHPLCRQAADAIEALTARIAQLEAERDAAREALRQIWWALDVWFKDQGSSYATDNCLDAIVSTMMHPAIRALKDTRHD